MATRKSSKPAKAKAAVPVPTDTERAGLEAEATCPCNLKGPAKDRIQLANFASYQVVTLLDDSLEYFAGFIAEDKHVVRALLSRARALSYAATTLLGDDEDAGELKQAMKEVSHG